MEQLKVEMVKRAREIGDTGSSADHRLWIGMFLDHMGQWLTPAAIESFTADELRGPYVGFVSAFLRSGDIVAASQAIPQYLRCHTIPRTVPVPLTADDPKVVSIFGKS